jgi:tRNA(His) 5'-end guanylyltransferase
MKDNLGDRCKNYEAIYERYFLPKTPIVVRCDGRSFHTWTKKNHCKRPYDEQLIDCMFYSAIETGKEMQNLKGLYVQSDEVTFVMDDSDSIETQQWFGGRQNKIESITAALMSANFNRNWLLKDHYNPKHFDAFEYEEQSLAIFDARAFQCPKEDVANVFLWRVRDWERNSLNMFCEQFFSHKELHGQGRADRHEMLHKIGHNWATECSDRQKNGSWWSPTKGERFDLTNYDDIDNFLFE